jgi:transcriptional regulator with XRE-family HTH domain
MVQMTDAISVGRVIQLLRKGKGLTQAQIADRLNISYQAISKWESGISLPDTSMLVDIATILETSTDFILNGGKQIMQFEKRKSVKDIQQGIRNLANMGNLIGRDTTVYMGLVDGINHKMNIDVEEMFRDENLLECLIAEIIIQNMANGTYIDISDVRSNLHSQKWIDIVCEYAKKYELK